MFTGKCYHSHFLIWIKNSSSSPSSFSGNCFISLIFFLIFLSLLWKESSYFWSCFKLGLITTNNLEIWSNDKKKKNVSYKKVSLVLLMQLEYRLHLETTKLDDFWGFLQLGLFDGMKCQLFYDVSSKLSTGVLNILWF